MEMIKKLRSYYIRYETYFDKQFKLVLVISMVVGIAVCLEASSWLNRRDPNVIYPRVLLATRDLPVGQVLTQIDLDMKSVPPPKPEGAVTDQDLHLVLGASLLHGLNAGEIISFDNLLLPANQKSFSKQVPRGMRAYSFEPENNIPTRVGDYVDIYLVKDRSEAGATLLTEGVQVLALKGREQGAATLLVAVMADDLPVLEKGRQLGKLIISLRNAEDFRKKGKLTRRSIDDLSQKRKQTVQLISEGE